MEKNQKVHDVLRNIEKIFVSFNDHLVALLTTVFTFIRIISSSIIELAVNVTFNNLHVSSA